MERACAALNRVTGGRERACAALNRVIGGWERACAALTRRERACATAGTVNPGLGGDEQVRVVCGAESSGLEWGEMPQLQPCLMLRGHCRREFLSTKKRKKKDQIFACTRVKEPE